MEIVIPIFYSGEIGDEMTPWDGLKIKVFQLIRIGRYILIPRIDVEGDCLSGVLLCMRVKVTHVY